MTKTYTIERKVGVKASPKFQEKQLANYALNVGMLCSHGCRYCSTPAVLCRNSAYKSVTGMTSTQAFETGAAIVDPTTHERIPGQMKNLKSSDIVMISTMTDPYAPEAQKYNLGRKCAQAVLENSAATVRILTKNAAVKNDFDLFAKYRDRVIVGLSVTGPHYKEKVVQTLEPNASLISERNDAYRKAQKMGLRTYGMLCPCMPGVALSKTDLQEMMDTILEFDPEDIWMEPVNARGGNLNLCKDTLLGAGFREEAFLLEQIQDTEMHKAYVEELVDNASEIAKNLGCFERLKILVYADGRGYACKKDAVIWLE